MRNKRLQPPATENQSGNDPFVVFLNTQIHDQVTQFLRAEPRGRVLDVGPGDGALTQRLKQLGFDATAVDRYVDAFKPTDIEIKAANVNEGLPYESGAFDVVVATELIEHLENPWFFVRELYRVTAPHGVVVLSTPNLDSIYVRAWYLLSGRLYNFMYRTYQQLGHVTPVFFWNLQRMIEEKFDIEAVTVNASPVPKTRILLPWRSRLLGQVIVVKLRRRPGPVVAEPGAWRRASIRRESLPTSPTEPETAGLGSAS